MSKRSADSKLSTDTYRDLVGSFEDSDPNDENYRIPPNLFAKIKGIVNDPRVPRYRNIDEFLNESIDLFTTWWISPQLVQGMMANLWEDLTPEMKSEIKKTAPTYFKQMEQMMAAKNQIMDMPVDDENLGSLSENIAHATKMDPKVEGFAHKALRIDASQILDEYPMVKSKSTNILSASFKKNTILPYDGYPLIWSFYTRIFPAKIALVALGDILNRQHESLDEAGFVDFKHFQNEAYNLAYKISEDFRKFEIHNQVPRNKRFSTGLPVPLPEYEIQDPEIAYMERKKVESSRRRYTNQFLGRLGNDGYVSGILNATGLAHFIGDKKNLKLGFSKEGLEFYKLENNVLDNYSEVVETKYDSILSFNEQEFLITKIIPKFTLESLIVNGICDKLKERKEIKADVIDIEIDESLSKWIKTERKTASAFKLDSKINRERLILSTRIGTMGRLTELGIVEWKMEKDGSSTYTSGKDFNPLYRSFQKSCKKTLEPNMIKLLN
ncbi:hypothetical protein OAJ67_01510 [Candidatus Nitrosopelagicus sp.]|nr:hypothetical protein [Candidatus Nitrosopelagicus sp.]